MMLALRTVHCPVDFSPATPRQIDLAADLCRAFGARLILHHNRHSLGTGAAVGWMWNADHHGESQAVIEAKLDECRQRVPDGIAVEPVITEGPVSRVVEVVAEAVEADLVILTAHGRPSEDHASISEKLIEAGDRAVLVLHEPDVEPRTPHFASGGAEPQVVIAPTDLSIESRAALEVAFDLLRRLPVELHLLHILPHGRGQAQAEERALEQMRTMVPPDLAGRVKLHVAHGNPAEGITSLADELRAACIVMGEHTRTLWGWFQRDTSREVLHQAHCPIWYVPGNKVVA
jgi:nucleotide-binding universal stress UspA family protein